MCRRNSSRDRLTNSQERNKILEVGGGSFGGQNQATNVKKMEAALNEWLEKVEDQVNILD